MSSATDRERFEVLEAVRAEGWTALERASAAKGSVTPMASRCRRRGLATSAEEAVSLAEEIGYPSS